MRVKIPRNIFIKKMQICVMRVINMHSNMPVNMLIPI